MKVRMLIRPTGLYNGSVWPGPGEEVDLPDHVAEGMIAAGNVEKIAKDERVEAPKVETAVAPKKRVEKRA